MDCCNRLGGSASCQADVSASSLASARLADKFVSQCAVDLLAKKKLCDSGKVAVGFEHRQEPSPVAFPGDVHHTFPT